ncbi:MAG: histidine--tRNA ligase, partial [Planctomycetes bacterium]|nr:histidine--tRNA ligase [Planctomycetota bacterium]
TRDFYPDQMAVRNWIHEGWRAASIRNGFVEYDGPIFEYLRLYTEKSGEEIASQLFSLTDRAGRELAIRPEMTPTLARMVNQKIQSLARPIKWFSVSRLCRAERPQKGRLREFFQWNIDIVGIDSVLADAECIYTAIDYLRCVGLTGKDMVVRISSRAMLAALLRGQGFAADQLNPIYTLLDKRSKISVEAFEELAAEQISDEGLRKKLMELQGCESLGDVETLAVDEGSKKAVGQLKELFEYLQIMDVSEFCEFGIRIVRVLAYYTGVVYEVYDRNVPMRALCGGGRYDGLLAGLGGPKESATGFGMGDVVLEIMLEEKNLLKSELNGLDAFVIAADRELFKRALELVSQLRAKGWATGFSYKSASLGKQLKQASDLRATYAVILGEETITSEKVIVKKMDTGTQTTMRLPELLNLNKIDIKGLREQGPY